MALDPNNALYSDNLGTSSVVKIGTQQKAYEHTNCYSYVYHFFMANDVRSNE